MNLKEFINKVKIEAQKRYLQDPESFYNNAFIVIKNKNNDIKEMPQNCDKEKWIRENLNSSIDQIIIVREVRKKSRLVNALGENYPTDKGIMVMGKDKNTNRTICSITKCLETRDLRDDFVKQSQKSAEEIIGNSVDIKKTYNITEDKTYDLYSKFGAEEVYDSLEGHNFHEDPILVQLYGLITGGNI